MYQAKDRIHPQDSTFLTNASMLAYMRASMRLKQQKLFSAIYLYEYVMKNARETVEENKDLHKRVAELEEQLATLQDSGVENVTAEQDENIDHSFDPDDPDCSIDEQQEQYAEMDVEQSISEQSEEANICDDHESQEYAN